jgi:hypothetical protein
MSFCSISKTIDALGTSGKLAAAATDANSAFTGGLN